MTLDQLAQELHALKRRNETPLALIASRSRLFAPLPIPHSRLTWRR